MHAARFLGVTAEVPGYVVFLHETAVYAELLWLATGLWSWEGWASGRGP